MIRWRKGIGNVTKKTHSWCSLECTLNVYLFIPSDDSSGRRITRDKRFLADDLRCVVSIFFFTLIHSLPAPLITSEISDATNELLKCLLPKRINCEKSKHCKNNHDTYRDWIIIFWRLYYERTCCQPNKNFYDYSRLKMRYQISFWIKRAKFLFSLLVRKWFQAQEQCICLKSLLLSFL